MYQFKIPIIALTAPAADQAMNPPMKIVIPPNTARLPFAVVSATRFEKLLFAFMTVSFLFVFVLRGLFNCLFELRYFRFVSLSDL